MKDIKNKNYAFRITEKDLNAINKKARKAKMTTTDYTTNTALNKEIIVIDGFLELRTEMRRIGDNLNQLTRLCHQGRITTVRLEETEDLIGEIKIKFIELVRRANKDGSA